MQNNEQAQRPDPSCIQNEVRQVNRDGLVVTKGEEEELCELYCSLISENEDLKPSEVEGAIKTHIQDLHKLYLAAKKVMVAAEHTGIEFAPDALNLDAD